MTDNKGEEEEEYLNPWGEDDAIAKSLKDFEERKAKLEEDKAAKEAAAAQRQKEEEEAKAKEQAEKKEKQEREGQPRPRKEEGSRDEGHGKHRRRHDDRGADDGEAGDDSRRRRGRDRSRDRRRRTTRSRSRSSSPQRRDRRRRSRYRSRSPGRGRYSPSRRDRRHGGGRDYDRRRGRDRDREHDDGRRRRRRSRSRSHERHRRSPSPAEPKRGKHGAEAEVNPMFNLSAALVVDRFIEVWSNNNNAATRVKELMELFDRRSFELLGLVRKNPLMSAEDLEESFKMTRPWTIKPSKRLFVESDRPTDPTYALDFYKRGQGPCFSHIGYSLTPPTTNVAVLYRVKNNQITTVHVAEDTEGLVVSDDVTEEDVTASTVGKHAFDVMIRPGGLGGTSINRVFNNYENIPVIG